MQSNYIIIRQIVDSVTHLLQGLINHGLLPGTYERKRLQPAASCDHGKPRRTAAPIILTSRTPLVDGIACFAQVAIRSIVLR